MVSVDYCGGMTANPEEGWMAWHTVVDRVCCARESSTGVIVHNEESGRLFANHWKHSEGTVISGVDLEID